MTDFAFSQVDVFATDPFTGNGLAVVHGGGDLPDPLLQRIAQWTNLAETSFLLPPTAPGADYRVRIFTPAHELPFAGHPTLGTAHTWLAAHPDHTGDEVVQQCGIGLVRVRRTPAGLAFAAPPLTESGPVDPAELATVADALGIEVSAVRAAEWVVNGPRWMALLLADAQAVLDVRPGPVPGEVGLVGPHPAGSEYAFEVRAFVPRPGGTGEDPVTGSLNAGIALWLLGSGRAAAPYTARQGTAVGRAGRVTVDRDADGTIWVGGAVRPHVTGTVTI